MHLPRKKTLWAVIIAVLAVCIVIGFLFSKTLTVWYTNAWQSYLSETEKPSQEHQWNEGMLAPSALNYFNTGTGTTIPPPAYNVTMEFHTQAPLLSWDHFHEEMCEEASILLVINYFKNRSMTNSEFDAELKRMKDGEEQSIGIWESTTVEELKMFIESYFNNYQVILIPDISIDQIERYVASDIPVLLPMSGRTIGNPFYKAPGPVYHMLVIKGYTKDHFITNDVGTKRGKDYFYMKDVIMQNIHNWDENNILHGKKIGFVILPK